MNPKLLSLLTLLFTLFASNVAFADPVNAEVGDRSWFEYRSGSPDSADSVDRIRTHLLWVENTLRAAITSQLSPEVSARRTALLDELARYRFAGAFPRHERAGDGRHPRWVDHEGRACAVGHLVAFTGHQDLFDEIAANHEYDFVPDIDVPELSDWADDHGFTAKELAMIQPSYSWGGFDPPTPGELERKRREEERKRRIPRPLKPSQVDGFVAASLNDRELKRACFGQATGTWSVAISTRITTNVRAQIQADVSSADNYRVPKGASECIEKELTQRVTKSLEFVNYTVAKSFDREHSTTIRIPNGDEISASFLEREAHVKHFGPVDTPLAQCFEKFDVSGDSVTIPLRVSSWNGQVNLRWNEIPEAKDHEYRKFVWCLQDVLIYGSVPEYGVWDHELAVHIDASGVLRLR